MSFLALAFPALHPDDFNFIQAYREKHDDQYAIINPHFTLIFPDQGIRPDMVQDAIGLAAKQHAIEFVLNKTISRKDDFSDRYYEFMVPSTGYNEIVKLRSVLYSGSLKPCLRKSIEFIPHITIGNSNSRIESESRLATFPEFRINGTINKISIMNFERGRLQMIAEVRLR